MVMYFGKNKFLNHMLERGVIFRTLVVAPVWLDAMLAPSGVI
jgi:hypothetical protein